MSSKTDIANLALSHLGIGKEIAHIDTEKSQEAATMRRFYEECRDAVLRDFPWSFSTKYAVLGLVADPPTETTEWAYSYRYPTDCLMVRRFQSEVRNDTLQTRIPFRIGKDSQGQLLYTDQPEAKIEYTIREDDTQRYTADFVLAFSLRLAAYAAPRLTGGDPFKMGNRAIQLYMNEIFRAQANSSNEGGPDLAPESEFIRAREGDTVIQVRGNG